MSRPATAEELAAQIQELCEFEHDGSADDYNQSTDAMWQAALLAFEYAADRVGATGFQASWAALRFYGEAMRIDGPFGVVKAEDALYPQYDLRAQVNGWLDEWRSWLAEKARENLADDDGFAVDRVRRHWEALAAAAPPARHLHIAESEGDAR